MIVYVKYFLNEQVYEKCHHHVTKVELYESDEQPKILVFHKKASNGSYDSYLLSWFPNLEVR